MQTQLRMNGRFVKDSDGQETFEMQLYDGDYVVDTIVYFQVAGVVQTPAGYAKTPAGARAHAKDEWF